jgi:CopG family nickel-responsive transcriptional regulator
VSGLYRFGVSLDRRLIEQFDRLLRRRKYSNRSEAIRDLIRASLVAQEWADGSSVAGAITLTYDHHRRDLITRLVDIQHDYAGLIVSTQHIHLDHHNCLEIVAVRGRAREAQGLADRLRAERGVKHVTLSMTTTGRRLA